MNDERLRKLAHKDLKKIATYNANIDTIETYSLNEVTNKTGRTPDTTLAHIHFDEQETVGTVQELQASFSRQGYRAEIKQKSRNDGLILSVQSTIDLAERLR
jgi:hypothetical protein